LTKKALNMRE